MKRIFTLPILLGVLLMALLVASGVKPALATAPTPMTLPVVFIPGIGGTRLADSNNVEYWTAAGYTGHGELSLYPTPAHPTLYPTNAITEATYLGVHVSFEDWQTYGPLFDYFQSQGFVQYNTYQDPTYQTSAGCDTTQASNHPNLFVFAYDWRISNAQNAALLADYIACVQKFYPNTKVNLVAHSMGGLVARRYILQYNNPNNVNALISVSSPYLGSGKVVWVEETGEYVFFVWASTLLNVVGSFNGASELLNTQAWYDMGGAPALIEDGQDLLGDGKTNEQFSYPMLVQYMNSAHGQQGFNPGTANQTFHSYTNGGNGQDDWRSDTTGVKYFHIAGEGLQPDTINQVVAASFWKCIKNYSICNLSTWMYPKFTQGDTTVPILSTSRISGTLNYNAPNATVYLCQSFTANNQNVDHTGLLSNPVVQNLVTGYLTQANGGTTVNPPPGLQCGSGSTAASPSAPAGPPAVTGTYRLTLSGVKNVKITDGTSDPISDGAAQYNINADSTVLLFDAAKNYDVTFDLTGDPFYMQGLHSEGTKIVSAARLLDQPAKAGSQGHFAVGSGGLSAFDYDANHDGVFEKHIAHTLDLLGKPARDVRAPKVKMTVTKGTQTVVTLTATDRSSGVAKIVYSLDGTHFQIYTKPFAVSPSFKTVYAFAEDKAGNRSRGFTFEVK